MAKIVFYCNVEKSRLNSVEFYKQDLDALFDLGHQVIICNRYREIPHDFDLIFIWWWTYAFWPVLMAKLLGKPSIVTGTFNFRFPENFDGTDYFKRPFWQKFLIKFAVKNATVNAFVNKIEYEGCTEYFKINTAKYYPHSIDKLYLQGPSKKRELKLFNIAWSGKQNLIRKGIPELVKAIKILVDEGMDIKACFAGHKGDGFELLKDMVNSMELQEHISLVGEISVEEKIEYLRKYELYIQPSRYEGFGLAIAEAMGSGACVVTCGVGAVKEVVGDTGLYVTPGSEQEIAEKIKQLLEDESLRIHYQKLGCQRIKDLFSYDNKLKNLDGLLGELNIKNQ